MAISTRPERSPAERSRFEVPVAERHHRQALGLCWIVRCRLPPGGAPSLRLATARTRGAGSGFIWWKSGASEPAIRAWNDSAPFPIYRTVDVSDGVALLILPFAVWAAANARPVLRHRVAGWVILACAWVGIIATSPGPPVKVSAEPLTVQYPLSISKAELLADLQLRGEISSDAAARCGGAGIESFRVRTRLSCGRRGGLEAELDIGETSGRAVVSPRKIKMDYSCVESSERNAVLAKISRVLHRQVFDGGGPMITGSLACTST